MKSSATPEILLDHCALGKTHQLLTARGLSCVTLLALGKAAAKNGEVLALAKERGAVLVTADLVFGDLREYPLGTHHGIIVMKLEETDGTAANQVLTRLLDEAPLAKLAGCLVVIDPRKYRVLHPPA